MGKVRPRDTEPERILRSSLHAFGFRYRLHVRTMPGCPDLVFPGRKKVIFVHGCFWHLHARCNQGHPPKTDLTYWKPKLEANRHRDLRNIRALRSSGWRVLVIWSCSLRSKSKREHAIRSAIAFLEKD